MYIFSCIVGNFTCWAVDCGAVAGRRSGARPQHCGGSWHTSRNISCVSWEGVTSPVPGCGSARKHALGASHCSPGPGCYYSGGSARKHAPGGIHFSPLQGFCFSGGSSRKHAPGGIHFSLGRGFVFLAAASGNMPPEEATFPWAGIVLLVAPRWKH